jgi:GNAT superfamily N-acetyltransferase
MKLTFQPLTAERWPDLVALFGERGACGGCWCMWWRLQRAVFTEQKGAGNKRALKKLADKGTVLGLIAYLKDQPIGWCAVAPREDYIRLEKSRILQPVDDLPVWSVTCFFVAKPFRGRGMVRQLLTAAISYVKKQGGRIVEGYPVEPKKGRMPDPFIYTGPASAYLKAGFKEVVRRSDTRPIMRYVIRR